MVCIVCVPLRVSACVWVLHVYVCIHCGFSSSQHTQTQAEYLFSFVRYYLPILIEKQVQKSTQRKSYISFEFFACRKFQLWIICQSARWKSNEITNNACHHIFLKVINQLFTEEAIIIWFLCEWKQTTQERHTQQHAQRNENKESFTMNTHLCECVAMEQRTVRKKRRNWNKLVSMLWKETALPNKMR